MLQRIAIIENNTVVNVIMWDTDNGEYNLSPDKKTVISDWVCIGDWWEESEQRFYRAIPNNGEQA